MLFQPSNITPDEISGNGCVDITEDLVVSWQVSGDTAMTAYKIDFMSNDSDSTLLYSTGKQTLENPFWGVDYSGNTQYFNATVLSDDLVDAGLLNGNEYKILITQWYTSSDYIEQLTASIFKTRNAPTIEIDEIDDPVSTRAYSFTATYSQAQNVPLKWVRWTIAETAFKDEPFVETGNIYGTGELRVDYDGFFADTSYSIKCDVETTDGIEATTGWVDFDVSYEVTPAVGNIQTCKRADKTCVWVQWDKLDLANGYSVYRKETGKNVLEKICDVVPSCGQIFDYSAKSGKKYTYYVFPKSSFTFATEPLVSEETSVQHWSWTIVEAMEDDNVKGQFNIIRTHLFRYGVTEASFSNNSNPTVSLNFTRYPTVQRSTANYLSGSVSGYIGTISNTKKYTDTLQQSEAVMELSNTENTLFLIDPKGHFIRIKPSSAVTVNITHKTKEMQQTVSFAWVEVGSTDGQHAIVAQGGDFYPTDAVIFSTLHIDTRTGALIQTTDESSDYEGSRLYLEDGCLMQNDDGAFTPAVLEIDEDTKILYATI